MKTPAPLASLSPRAQKRVRWLLGILLVYTLLGFLILPPIIRMVAVKQLSKQLGREVTIQKVKLNPYALSATVRGLLIKDPDGPAFVSWDEVYVNFQLSSFFGHPWVFSKVAVAKPFIRVQINPDHSFNFSDLLTNLLTSTSPQPPSKPLALRVDSLEIKGASASFADLTPRTPYRRTLGPVDVSLVNFQTDPANKNPYSVSGTTETGEKISWSGYFFLNPIRSKGDFSLENLVLNKFTPLYQDLVPMRLTDGSFSLHTRYEFEFSDTNLIARITDTSFSVHSLKVAESETGPELLSVPDFGMSGINADAGARQAEVGQISGSGTRLTFRRDKDKEFNIVEAAKPTEPRGTIPRGVILLLRGMTNAAALFLNSTNAWSATIHAVDLHDFGLALEDLSNPRPARLNLDNIELSARHISNLPGSNLTASVSLRWNTNGAIKTDMQAGLSPLAADVQITLDRLELKPLDPYLENRFNVFIRGSKFSMDSQLKLRARESQLPEATFAADIRLDDFSTVDGAFEDELLKWNSVRISGLQAGLNPPTVAIKELAVNDLAAYVMVETNQSINLKTALRLSDTNSTGAEQPGQPVASSNAPPAAASPSESQPQEQLAGSQLAGVLATLPKISIENIVISNAEFRLTDRSTVPNLRWGVEQVGGNLAGLSTEESGRAELSVHALVDNVGPVEVTGRLYPLSLLPRGKAAAEPAGGQGGLTNEIRIKVKNVDLTPTSPYVGRFAGYRLDQGMLDLDLTYHVHERNVKSENLIELDQFTLGEKVNSPEATKLPVRLAVAILKDRDGKIKLDVPIEGSLDDPKFRLGRVIVSTLGNLFTRVVTSPFSVLSGVFGGKGEELSYQDFAPGSAQLPNGEKLDTLAKGLYERPGLKLEVLGSVDPEADRDGLRHLAIEKWLREAKYQSLGKAAREASRADELTLTSEERTRWLKEVYGEALSKGEIPASAVAAATGGNAEGSAAALSGLQSKEPRQGAGMLMAKKSEEPAAAKGAQSATMEDILANSINISDSGFQALASARAKVVREYLIEKGKVEAERVAVAENSGEGVRSQGAKAQLQFR